MPFTSLPFTDIPQDFLGRKACVETVCQLQVISRIHVHASVSVKGEIKFEYKDPALPSRV